MQAAVRAAPPKLRQELVSLGFRGALATLSKHPCANFVVQALLGSATSPTEVCTSCHPTRQQPPCACCALACSCCRQRKTGQVPAGSHRPAILLCV